jgi:drug/metabolite transporter (DMT)-like permease
VPERQAASALAIWAALAAVYLVWGSTYLAIRFTVETMPPFLSAATRFVISGGFLYSWRRLAGDPRPSPEQWRNASIIGIFLLVGGNGGVVWASQFISSSLAALLVSTVPLWMILFDAVRHGEKPRGIALIGILIGFCGAALLVGWSAHHASAEHLHGAVAVLVASCLWAVGSIYGKTATLPASSLLTTAIEMLAGGIVLSLLALLFGELAVVDPELISTKSAAALLYLTVIGPIAFVAYAWLLRVAPIPLVATYSYVNPLVAILLGYFLGNEILTPRILVAAVLIIGSVVLVSRPRK